jgi:hypothetical protein
VLAKSPAGGFAFIERWVRPVDFTVSGFCQPAFNLRGAPVPHRGRESPLPFVTVNVVPAPSGSFVSIGIPLPYIRELGPQFIDLRAPMSDEQFIDLVWSVTLSNIENVAIRPDAWSRLDPTRREAIESFFNSTVYRKWVAADPDALRLS